jgi:hypothetical protein
MFQIRLLPEGEQTALVVNPDKSIEMQLPMDKPLDDALAEIERDVLEAFRSVAWELFADEDCLRNLTTSDNGVVIKYQL